MDYSYSRGKNFQMIYFSYPKAGYLKYSKEIDRSIQNVLNSDRYIKGESVSKFEFSFSNYIGTKYSVGTGNATDAIFLSLRALDIGTGDEVLTVSHTATGTVAAIANTGATPVFADINKDSFTIRIEGLEKKISNKTKAIIVVHIYGQPCDMDEILYISNKYGIPVIEDCAQASGAEYKGKKVGSMGTVGCFSFFPTKNLSCIGDGGLATTNDKTINNKIRSLGEYGWDKKRDAQSIGINSRLDELQAAILNVKLKYLDQDNKERRDIASSYRFRINNSKIHHPIEMDYSYHVYHLYVIIVDKVRDQLINYLKKGGVYPGVHYPLPVHRQKVYKNFLRDEKLKNTEKIIKQIVSIPIYQGMEKEHVDKTIDLLNNF